MGTMILIKCFWNEVKNVIPVFGILDFSPRHSDVFYGRARTCLNKLNISVTMNADTSNSFDEICLNIP